MHPHLVFWGSCLGLAFLLAGLVLIWEDFSNARGFDKFVVLGYAFVAAPLAVFGTEHLLTPHALVGMVPSWIPAPMFWVYFVGIGLFLAALSFIARRYLTWSALLLAIMFFIFVATMDLPEVAAHAKERLFWTLVLRESAFGGGALALAGWARRASVPASRAMFTIGRTLVGAAVTFYGVKHFIFPKTAPGVPLEKMTPDWVPMPNLLAYAVGAVLVAAGLAMLFNWRTRVAAGSVGLVMTLLTFFFYFPIFLKAIGTAQSLEELNYVGDTLLFGGTALFVGIAARGFEGRTEAAV